MRNGKMAEKSGIQRQEVSTALELLIGKIEVEGVGFREKD